MPGSTVDKVFGHTNGKTRALAISPDKSTVASGGTGTTVQLWRAASGTQAGTIKDHTDAIGGLVITPDGKTLVSASADRSIRFWQPSDGKFLGSASDPALPVQTVVSFSC
jgi:WD40 repeat protein